MNRAFFCLIVCTFASLQVSGDSIFAASRSLPCLHNIENCSSEELAFMQAQSEARLFKLQNFPPVPADLDVERAESIELAKLANIARWREFRDQEAMTYHLLLLGQTRQISELRAKEAVEKENPEIVRALTELETMYASNPFEYKYFYSGTAYDSVSSKTKVVKFPTAAVDKTVDLPSDMGAESDGEFGEPAQSLPIEQAQ